MEDLFYNIINNKIKELAKLAKNEPLDIRDETGDTPLMCAIRNKNIKSLSILLKNGASPNFPDIRGWFPLHFATQKENIEMIELLVKNDANINQQDGMDGRTPLAVSIGTQNKIIIDYLLKQGADIHIPSKRGVTPASAAKLYGISLE